MTTVTDEDKDRARTSVLWERLTDAGYQELLHLLAAHREAAENARIVRSAFMEGFTSAAACLPENDAECLTEDVEADMWADSTTRKALENRDDQ